MSSKKKPSKKGGRVTAKGTKAAPKKATVDRPGLPDKSERVTGHVPQRVRGEQGRGARPISHNRGNR